MTDLFDPVVPGTRLNPRFKLVADGRAYAPARATMRETFAKMGPRDPNFIEQFQTTGFDARFSELYLYAALDSAGLDVATIGAAPDFVVSGHGHEWAIEVTTANPAGGAVPAALPDDPVELQRISTASSRSDSAVRCSRSSVGAPGSCHTSRASPWSSPYRTSPASSRCTSPTRPSRTTCTGSGATASEAPMDGCSCTRPTLKPFRARVASHSVELLRDAGR
jgi:hypothetical protein